MNVLHQPIRIKTINNLCVMGWQTKARCEPARQGSGHDQPCIKAKVAAIMPGVAAFGSAIFDLMNQLRHLGDSLHRALMPSRSQSDDNSNYCDH